MKKIFITGIDTGVGKTYVTAYLAKAMKEQGLNVSTFKLVQTGSDGIPADIIEHRRIMGEEISEIDKIGKSCSYVFKFPASPHLAASLVGLKVDVEKINYDIEYLSSFYNYLLIEGVGGLMVPLNDRWLTSDLPSFYNWPVIIVTSGRLGSINHTLLTLEFCKAKNINVIGVVYNHIQEALPEIKKDSALYLRNALRENYFYNASFIEINNDVNTSVLPLITAIENT